MPYGTIGIIMIFLLFLCSCTLDIEGSQREATVALPLKV